MKNVLKTLKTKFRHLKPAGNQGTDKSEPIQEVDADTSKTSPKLVANKRDRVLSLLELGVPVNAVVDVGVQKGTWELMQALGDKHHHLFEPVSLWYSDIENNYASISSTLYPVALSNEIGSAWLLQTSLLKDGVATHARITQGSVNPDGKEIVDCQPIKIDRLDSYSHLFGEDYLLKVDVDGKDLEVLQGASGCISNASVVIVEAHWASLTERGKALEEYGFSLIDIIDRVMYGQVLWQCDLVYLRNDLMNEKLRPPMFDPAHWHPLP